MAGLAVAGCTASPRRSTSPPTSPPTSSGPPALARGTAATWAAAGTLGLLGLPAPVAGTALPGYLLIADRDNNRLIVVNAQHQVVWRFPLPGELSAGQRFSGPDDAFLAAGGAAFITNEELAETIALVALAPKPHIAWEYGHYGDQGSASGYLAHPDDAYLLANGLVSAADIINCRVIWIDRAGVIVRSLGHPGDCVHDPPRSLSDPNGDTPLPDGGVLVTEIGGWVDRFTAAGRLVYSIRTPTTYPSDAQLLKNGDVLVASYNNPGRVDILTPSGRIVWTYDPPSGPGALDHPSLAVELPDGTLAVTDDRHHRVVVIDLHSKRIVWEYGHDGVPGSGPGYLDKPDGLAFIP